MRCQTVSQAKGKITSPHCDVPKEGTKIRALYDRFFLNKGKTIPLIGNHENLGRINRLMDDYGLDIRHVGRGNGYILAGEWFGKVYVDYIAERLEE